METLNRLDRPNKSPVKLAEPPMDLRSGQWEALHYWAERATDGHITNVVCDACGSVYWGKWTALEVKDSPTRVVPDLGAGLLWDRRGKVFACTCPAGKRWAHVFPVASGGLVKATLEAGGKLSAVGARMLKELGGPTRALQSIQETVKARRAQATIRTMPSELRREIQNRFTSMMERPNVVAAMKFMEDREKSMVARLWASHQTHLAAALTGDPVAAEANLVKDVLGLLEAAREFWRNDQNDDQPVADDSEPGQKFIPASRDRVLGIPETRAGVSSPDQEAQTRLPGVEGREDSGRPPQSDAGGDEGRPGETGTGPEGEELASPPHTGEGDAAEPPGGQVQA